MTEGILAWIMLGLLGALALIDLTIHLSALMVIRPIFERIPPFSVHPAPPHPDGEPIEFSAPDGRTVRGSMYRHEPHESRGLIIFCPEMDGNHWSAMEYCAGLWDAGFDILAFDFRGQGSSDSIPGYQPLHWLTDYEVEDVRSAIEFASTYTDMRGKPMGLFGISRGGSAALAAAAQVPEVECVACDGAFSTESMMIHFTFRWAELYFPRWFLRLIPRWHLFATLQLVRWTSQVQRNCRFTNLHRLLPRLSNRNVLVVAGQRDTYVQPVITEEIFRRIGGRNAELWMVPKAKHNQARKVAEEEYDERLVKFFSQMAAAPVRQTVPQQA